ncbi:MAG: hypothetical protein KDC26_08475 [Armatimonadetes bacterium]|nr:hypothetical protein [Armatimonadota bacterium]
MSTTRGSDQLKSAMPEAGAQQSQSLPRILLALTCLIIGLTFALPFQLVPEGAMTNLSPEAMNVYACTAWAGWAHFVFAYRGQGGALTAVRDAYRSQRLLIYLVILVGSFLVLAAMRYVIGTAIFGALVWVYFIDHFLKAEKFFASPKAVPEPILKRWLNSYQPILTFGWLTVVLLDMGEISQYRWIMWGVSVAIAVLILATGGWKDLLTGDKRGTLLSLFFVAEAAVWGTLSYKNIPVFLAGVYIFHIAFGSYYHYLGSYFVGNARMKKRDIWLLPITILLINGGILALGYFVANYPSMAWLEIVLGVKWFTLWVGMHLVASDVFPLVKKWGKSAPTPA